MATRSYRLPSPYEQTPPVRRASGLGLALTINLLLLLAFLGLKSAHPSLKMDDGGALMVDLPRSASEAREQQQQEERRPKTQPMQKPVPPKPKIVLPVKPTITPEPEVKLNLVEMTPRELDQVDLALSRRSAQTAGSGNERGADSEVVGVGPHGETLYAASWMRRPTAQELGFYIPADAPANGWALIACKTYPQFRVDDCYGIETSPGGAKLGRAALEAAWQFKVRPPRKNGEDLVGEWVRIKITYVREEG